MSKTLTLQALNDDLAGALHAAEDGTVFITDDDGKPSYLLSYPAWKALASGSPSILDRIRQKTGDAESVEFDPEPAKREARCSVRCLASFPAGGMYSHPSRAMRSKRTCRSIASSSATVRLKAWRGPKAPTTPQPRRRSFRY